MAKEIAKFYFAKSNWDKAVKYFEMHLKNNQEDVETQILLLQTYTEKLDFAALGKNAEYLMQLFPTQPQFYYYAGLAYNQLEYFKKGLQLWKLAWILLLTTQLWKSISTFSSAKLIMVWAI